MPSINQHFLQTLKGNYKEYPCFIETGTLYGDTTFAMEPHFDKLYTIEFSELYHNMAKGRYHGDKIRFLLGDSSIVLNDLLPEIQENTIFFLDGHWSSGNTGRSAKDCPLVEELTAIRDHFKHAGIIIVDDARLFGRGPENGNAEDWTCISTVQLLSVLESRITDHYFLDSEVASNDRLIIHLGAVM